MKGRNRKLCHFKVLPPDVGQYLLKIYAKPEADIATHDEQLDHVATIPIHVIQVSPRHRTSREIEMRKKYPVDLKAAMRTPSSKASKRAPT